MVRLSIGFVSLFVLAVQMPLSRAQSTLGSIVGTVRDPSSAAVPRSSITVRSAETSLERQTTADENGSYLFPNLEPGIYEVTVQARGFQRAEYKQIPLLARETVRIDVKLLVGNQAQAVEVSAAAGPAIETDVSNLAQTKTGRELIDLPLDVTARAAGSTSPLSTLTAQPGVQADQKGNISVAGGLPSMLSVTVDGISTVNVTRNGPIAELFPSLNSIAEIKVSEVNNSAEFGSVSDITTVSRGGSNVYHGGVFENYQNSYFDARNPFSATKQSKIMNNFGAFAGGPILIPRLYSGRNRTFFFGGYEGLRLPRQSFVTESVPSLAYRSGDLSSLLPKTQIYNPLTGAPYPNNRIPVNPVSANILNLLYPLPNQGAPGSNVNNYGALFATPISSDQFDIRADEVISSRQSAFARFTYKTRSVMNASTGSALLGSLNQPEKDWNLTAAHNFVLTPNLINELRGGFSGQNSASSFVITSSIVQQIGITGLPSIPTGSYVPYVTISGFQSTGGPSQSSTQNRTYQVLDNLTWTKGRHTFKAGGDFRYLNSFETGAYGPYRLGQYSFNGSVTSLGRNGKPASASNPPLAGNPFAAFLLGVPDATFYANTIQGNSDAFAGHWAFYGQDDWRVSSRLTLNFGLRWEYNPMFNDHLFNIANFLPDYTSVVNGATVRGAVAVANQQALSNVSSGFAQSVAPTPILTAAQAGIPPALRYSQKTDFGPRVGFAWRPFGDNRTVVRGGYGRFMVTVLGGLNNAGWADASTYAPQFNQSLVNGQPALQFPSPFLNPNGAVSTGSQTFLIAQAVHYQDPYVQQWNLTFEREILKDTGLRLTYTGSKGTNLATEVNTDQVPANTSGFASVYSQRPYPLWQQILTAVSGAESHYEAGAVEVHRRFSGGLQFQSSYTFSKNLSNAEGYAPSASPSFETGGIASDPAHLGLDYGNVVFTPKHRFLTTFLWELPFGKNKPYLSQAGWFVDMLVNHWELAGVWVVQTGQYLTPVIAGSDPSGTGFTLFQGSSRPDIVAGKSGNKSNPSPSGWFDAAAYVAPQNNIGRFGDEPVGGVTGPGTAAVALSLTKKIPLGERAGVQFGTQITNLINHVNLATPNLNFGTGAFGTVGNVQTNEGAGPRVIQLSMRITF